MKSTVARGWLVLTVFALVTVLSVAERRMSDAFRPPPPPAVEANANANAAPSSASPFPVVLTTGSRVPPVVVFVREFRFYISWALLVPGIFFLARRFPLDGRRRLRSVAVHLLVPVAGSLPLCCYQALIAIVLGAEVPGWDTLSHVPWSKVFILQATDAMPVYWLLVGLGTVVHMVRAQAERDLREAELRRSLAAAQLDALKLKLQPHFLFNTLNAITALAGDGDTDAVGSLVERLGTLLRLSMETSGRQLVPLEEELALADAYLAIEEVRLGERLHVVRRIAPEARQALVPNLILQPLLENALVHGLGQRLEASLLEVAAHRDHRVLRIAVRDDGPGLPAGWHLDTSAGASLRNVRDRVRGLFPGQSEFELQNGTTGGTVALLSIPFADAATTAMGVELQPWTA